LQLNADDRIGAEKALRHHYFSALPRKLYELPDGEFCFTTSSLSSHLPNKYRKGRSSVNSRKQGSIMGSTVQDAKQTGCGQHIMLCILHCVQMAKITESGKKWLSFSSVLTLKKMSESSEKYVRKF
jgi:hypothetical protein